MKLAIQGHSKRGKEVIQILESLGGKNENELEGICKTFYYINDENEIWDTRKKNFPPIYKLYTLEEFEKEFPFKIGDKVTIIGLSDFPKVITKMAWDCDEILYSFEGLNNTWFGVKSLKKFEMKEERNITLTLDKAKEWYKKGGELKEIALQAFSEKELNPLPKTWEEFCTHYNTINDDEHYIDSDSNLLRVNDMIPNHNRLQIADRNICPSKESAEAHLAMIQLEQLRNCWWNGWEPEWGNCEKYVIKWDKNDLIVFTARNIHAFLVFPTREMAIEFLECFRDLIELARNLI